jgi:hypothetical protein
VQFSLSGKDNYSRALDNLSFAELPVKQLLDGFQMALLED